MAEGTGRLLFETRLLQTHVLNYAVESTTAQTSLAQALKRMNAKAARGCVFVSDYALSAANFVSIYVKGQIYSQQIPIGGVVYPWGGVSVLRAVAPPGLDAARDRAVKPRTN